MPRQAFSIRLNPQEKARYQALATSRGISLGEWTREAMKAHADNIEEHLQFLKETLLTYDRKPNREVKS